MQRYILKVCLVVMLVISGLATVSGVGAASSFRQDSPVYIYFFWGEGCPHCAAAKPFLDDLTRRYPQAEVVAFEIYNSPDNQALFKEMAAAHGFEPRYVPTIFVGDQHWEGFADQFRGQIEAGVRACVEGECPDAGAGIVPGHEAVLHAPPSGEICDVEATECDDTEDEISIPGIDSAPPPATGTQAVAVTLFYGDAGCLQCDANKEEASTEQSLQALRFLEVLGDKHPTLEVKTYEVWLIPANAARLSDMAQLYGVAEAEVPVVFVGDRVWQGFDAEIAQDLQAYAAHCLSVGCPPPAEDADSESRDPAPVVSEEAGATSMPDMSITIPLLGTVSMGGKSLWASTALISFVDGFNPCSLWVLSVLIALTLRTGSRKRIFTIGLIYITVTAGVYVLFIAGLFTVLSVVSFLGWIQAAVSILALFFAAVNIKDYFWYKEGLSFTIADEKKPAIYKRMRKVMNAGNSFWALAGATVALGAGVSLVEFSCTAGFPVIWTNLVAAQGVAPLTFALLLLLYMVIYQIDELVIFGVAVATLKASRLEEKHGRILKLVGGMLMLTLAGVMLVEPALMNNLGSSLLIFGGALVLALLVLILHRRVLPRLGIRIGSELSL